MAAGEEVADTGFRACQQIAEAIAVSGIYDAVLDDKD
jgi:hypothetical protein